MSDPEATRSDGRRYTFDVASRKMEVSLADAVVDGINGEVLKGFGALPRRGAEVGGLLLGRETQRGGKTVVVVETFDPIAIQYVTGPSYHLSDADREAVDRRLAMWRRSSEHRLWVVGIYRSHTRKEFTTDDEDVTLCSRILGDECGLFLLIKPYATRAAVAGWFFWDEGKLERSPESPDFPFEPTGLRAPAAPQTRAAAAGAASGPAAAPAEADLEPAVPISPDSGGAPFKPRPLSTPLHFESGRLVPGGSQAHPDLLERPEALAPHAPAPEATTPARGRNWTGWAVAAAAVILAAGGYALRDKFIPAAPVAPPNQALELSATDNQGQVEIGWNRSAPIVMRASRGVLTIVDGAARREMELDAEQVRGMHKVVYTRLTGDVLFRLEVFSGDRSLSESLRVLKPGTPAPDAAAIPAAAEPAVPPPAKPPVVHAKPAHLAAAAPQQVKPEARRKRERLVPETQRTVPPAAETKAAEPAEAPIPPREIPRPGRRR